MPLAPAAALRAKPPAENRVYSLTERANSPFSFGARVLAESSGIPELRTVALRGAILSACLPTCYFWIDSLHDLPIVGPSFWGA